MADMRHGCYSMRELKHTREKNLYYVELQGPEVDSQTHPRHEITILNRFKQFKGLKLCVTLIDLQFVFSPGKRN